MKYLRLAWKLHRFHRSLRDLDPSAGSDDEQMIVTIRMPSKFYSHFKAAPMTGEILSAERESPDQRRT